MVILKGWFDFKTSFNLDVVGRRSAFLLPPSHFSATDFGRLALRLQQPSSDASALDNPPAELGVIGLMLGLSEMCFPKR